MTASLGVTFFDLVVAAGVVLLLCAVTAFAAALWVRRRWRRLRLQFGPEAVLAAAGRSLWRWALARPLPDGRWREVTRSRRRLLLSVAAAERAVEVAGRAGAPLGDLRSLSRRLRSSADALDATLAVELRGTARSRPLPDPSREVDDLLRAAAHIHESAVLALSASSGAVQAGLARDAEQELAAFSAGLRDQRRQLGISEEPGGSARSTVGTLAGAHVPLQH